MITNCPEHLNKMTENLRAGMTFAMSIWKSDSLEWLQHGVCEYNCSNPDLRFKNLVFTTATGGETVNPIAAGFEAIRKNPNYGTK